MVLIDTSAWIEFFRRHGDPAMKSVVTDLFRRGVACYTCPVRYELYLGAKADEIANLSAGLKFAQRLPVTSGHWDRAAALGAELRSKGLTLPALDILIAVVANSEGLPLLAKDAHFMEIRESRLGGLKLWE